LKKQQQNFVQMTVSILNMIWWIYLRDQ